MQAAATALDDAPPLTPSSDAARHLLLAVVYWPQDDPPRLGSLMLAYPWTQVLTWILQVMPLFFAFGGAANARAWIRAKETHTPYSTWMWGRIQRLLRPVTI